MAFIDSLRMNGLFTPDNQNPLGAPNLNSGLDASKFSSFLGQISPNIQSYKNYDMDRQMQLMDKQQSGRLAEIAAQIKGMPARANNNGQMGDPNQPMNVVFKDNYPAINPFQAASLNQNQQKINQTGALGWDKLGISQEDTNIKQQRANIYDYKTKNPDMKIIMPPGGNVTAVNTKTGETHDLGISSGKMSEEDRLNLTGQQRMNQIDEQGNNSMDVQRLRGSDGLASIAARISGQKSLQDSKNAAASGKGELPTQTKVRQGNAARQLSNSRPDLAPFITANPDGSFAVTPPGTNFFGSQTGPTKEQFDEINKNIFGSPNTTPNKPAPKVDNDPLGLLKKNDDEDEG